MSYANFPTSPAAYNYWENEWVFGLPPEGQLSSPTCGALPFRNGSGVNQSNCLRGEDLAFLWSCALNMGNLPDILIWTDGWGSFGMYSKTVHSNNHNYMVQFLSGMQECSCYGEDIFMEEGDAEEIVVQEGEEIWEATDNFLKNQIKNPVQFSSTLITPGSPLLLANLRGLFTDMQKMKCTLGLGSELSSEPYWDYSDTYYESDPNPQIIQHDGRGLRFRGAYGPPNGVQTIEMEAKVIYIMQCSQLGEHGWTTKYAAVCLPSRATFTNASDNIYHRMQDTSFVADGEEVAELAFGACGMDMRPQHGEDWSAAATCQVYWGPVFAVYPKWLVDF